MSKIEVLILDDKTRKVEVKEIENELEAYYKELDCDLIEIHPIEICGKTFLAVMDEEGLINGRACTVVRFATRTPMFFGSVMICNEDGPELASLKGDDVGMVKSAVHNGVIWL